MSLKKQDIALTNQQQRKSVSIEARMFDIFLVVVIIGFPSLLTFLTWRFWGAGLK